MTAGILKTHSSTGLNVLDGIYVGLVQIHYLLTTYAYIFQPSISQS